MTEVYYTHIARWLPDSFALAGAGERSKRYKDPLGRRLQQLDTGAGACPPQRTNLPYSWRALHEMAWTSLHVLVRRLPCPSSPLEDPLASSPCPSPWTALRPYAASACVAACVPEAQPLVARSYPSSWTSSDSTRLRS